MDKVTVEPTEFVEVHEIANGMWSLIATIMLIALIRYIFNIRAFSVRHGHTKWWLDIGVQFALAMIIMVTGHMLRGWMTWIQFVMLRYGEIDNLLTSPQVLIPPLFLIILGKFLVLWTITPRKWRKCFITASALIVVTIPIAFYYFI